MAKGAGMICPDMATMLAFLATDARGGSRPCCRHCLKEAVDGSFNAITVDGDTSTNDACVLVATGALGNPLITDAEGADRRLPQVRPGRRLPGSGHRHRPRRRRGHQAGAASLIEGGPEPAEARRVAYAIAHSPLVKTAALRLGPQLGAHPGGRGPRRARRPARSTGSGSGWALSSSSEAAGGAELHGGSGGRSWQPEILIRVALGRGEVETQVLTCDLSYDYVRINAEYRT